MKLKRLIAIVVSLAMVLSMVPAFSLTASAADMSDVALLNYAKTTSPLFDAMNPAPTAADDTAIATAWPNSGWSGGNGNSPDANGGYLNVAGGTATPRIQAYVGSKTNGSINISTITLPGYGAGNDWVLLSFTAEHTAAWGDVALYDIDGAIITGFRTGTGGINAVWGHTGWGNPYDFSSRTYSHLNAESAATAATSGSAKVDVLMRNYADYYTASVYVNGTLANTTTYTGATFNGLGSIAMNRGSGEAWQRISMQQPLVYAGDIPETSVGVTATYTYNGETILTKESSYDTSTGATGVTFDALVHAPNGSNAIYTAEAVTLSESATVEMTKLTNNGTYAVGDSVVYGNKKYDVAGGNLVPNGDFTHGLTGWYTGSFGEASSAGIFSADSATGMVTASANGEGDASNTAFHRAWDVTVGTTYLFVYESTVEHGYQKFAHADTLNAAKGEKDLITAGVVGENMYVFTAEKEYVMIDFRWINNGDSFGNFGLYEVQENTTDYQKVIVNYDYNGETLATEELAGVAGTTITAPAKSVDVENGVVIFEAADYTIGEAETTQTLTHTKFVSFESGLLANYNFASGDVTDVINGFNGNVIGSKGVTFNKNGYVTLPGGVAQGALEIPAEVATYLTGDFTVSMWVKQDTSYASDSKSVAFWDIAVDNDDYDRLFYQQAGTGVTVQHRGTNPSRVYTTYTNDATKGKWALVTASFDLDANTLTTYINGVALTDGATTDTWGTGHAPANIYNRANGGISFYLGHNHWNNTDNPELMGDMADVRIYNKALTADEVNALLSEKKTMTVKYMADGAEVTDSTTVEYFTTAATFDVPTVITSEDGTVYEPADIEYAEGAKTVEVTAEGTEYTVTYKVAEIIGTGVVETPAATVIEGNTPILPSTVTVTTNKAGITYEANVTWDTSSLSVGENTVTGTVEGYEVTATANVTVLEESFALADSDSINGGDGNVVYFPKAITDEFTVEFDYTINKIADVSLQMGYNGNTYGAAALGISPNGSQLKATGGDKAGTGEGITLIDPVNAGETYRMLLTMDASLDTYTLTVTKPDGTTVTTGEKGFRQAQDAINTMTLRTNGGDNATDGDITVSNIKIHSVSIRKATVTLEYTTSDGTVVGTYTHNGYTGDNVVFPVGVYTAADGTKYDVEEAIVDITETKQTVTVKAVKLEAVTVNYVYEGEILKTVTLYGVEGTEVSNAAIKIAKDGTVYEASAVTTVVDIANPTVSVDVTIASNAIAASKTESYNVTAGAVYPYPTGADRNQALVGTDAMFSASWGDDRYGEMVFDVTTAENEDITTAVLTLTPGDIMADGYPNTFNIYAAAPESYGSAVDHASLTAVGSGEFAANDAPVDITLDLTGFDASNGVMLIYKQTNGLAGVYGASFIDAPVLKYEIREKTSATFTYVCEGAEVGSVTKEGYVGDTVSVELGYYTAENGTKYYVDAASVVLVSGENTAEVNARKLETVTINYTLSGETKKTVVLEGFAGDAVIAPAVYVNVNGAAYWADSNEYTLVAGGSTADVELVLDDNATFASTTETYNATTGEVIAYPEGADRNSALFGTDAMFSASWGDDRYGEILFSGVKTTGDDVITSARLTLTPGDVMGGFTNTYTIYAANVETYGKTNNLASLPVIGSGAFTANDVPVTIDVDLSDYDATEGVMLIYKVTGGLIGAYGASFGDKAPRLEFTMGEPGARVEVSDEFIVEYAKSLLPSFDSTNPPLPSTGYLTHDQLWEGFSVTESGVSRLDVYSESLNEPIVRVVSTSDADMNEKTEPSVVHTAGYGEGSEYVLFSFNPEIGTALWSDIGLRDLDGKLITAFRINNTDTVAICPNWGHVGTATPYKDAFPDGYSFDPAGDAKATLVSLVSQVDVLMRNFDPDSTVEGDEYYTVAYSVDGNVFTVGTYPGNFNGLKDVEMSCAGGGVDQYNGIAAVKIYSGRDPRIVGSITANYIYNNEIVHSETKYYDKDALAAGEVAELTFDEFYYSELGSHLLYRVPAQTLSANTNIDVVQYHPTTGVVTTLIHNWSHDNLLPSDLYTNAETGKTYMIATRNLIPNGNFEYGLASWYNGMLGEPSEIEFVPNHENGTVIVRANGTTISDYGLYNAWTLEKGETYLFTYTATGANATYAGITQTDVIDTVSYDPTLSTKLVDGTNYVVFEAESDYLKLNVGWSMNAEIGSFGLYKLEIIETGDIYRTIIEGSDPVLPKYVAVDGDGWIDRVVWNEEELNNLQIGENTVTGDLYTEVVPFADEDAEEPTEESTGVVDGDMILVPKEETITATVMVYPETFKVDDFTSYDGQDDVVASGGNVKFESPVTGKFAVEMDVTVKEYGDLWIILNDSEKTNDTSFFGKDQILISPSYFGGEIYPQDGNGNGGRDDLTQLAVAGRNKPYRFFIEGDLDAGTYSVTVTTPEGVTRTIEDFGIRTLSEQIDSITMLTNSDGTGEFTATNIKVYDLEPINAQYILTENGEEVKELGTEVLGEYFYGEEVVLPEGKFYTSYYDETLPGYETEEPTEDSTGESSEEVTPNDNVAHIVKTTEEQTFIVESKYLNEPRTIYVEMHKENAVLYDTFATGTESELAVAENLLYAGANDISEAPKYDDDGDATVTAGSGSDAPRIPLLTFNIPEFNEGEVVMLNLYAYQANQSLGEGNSMKLAVGAVDDVEVDENTVYAPDSVASLENLIWSDGEITQTTENDGAGRYTVTGNRVAIDVTDLVVKAKEDGKTRITFAVYAPTAGAYIMNRESTRYGAIHQGDFAGFLEAENDAYTLTVKGASKVTKNGSAVQLVDGGTTTVYIRNDATAKMYTEDASHVAFVESTTPKVHHIETETTPENISVRRATVAAATMVDDGVYYPVKLGADIVNGAQVRIGGGVGEDGTIDTESGLRFITVVDQNETLATYAIADETMELGVKITAEGSSQVVYIPAEMWQTEGAVFTSALTNLATSNYNRNFTAVPYIKCTDADGVQQEYTNASVTRSIYQVAAGLLAKGYDRDDTDGEDDNGVDVDGNYKDDMGDETNYESMPQILVDVLNAYVNQTGVRLTLSDSSETAALTARMSGSGAYTGEAFFTVGETEYADGKYTVTLTAIGQSVINTELFSKYVRINNNNAKVAPVTTITDNGDGTYTLVFDYSNINN